MPDPTAPGDDVPEYAPAGGPAWAERLSLLTAPPGSTARQSFRGVALAAAIGLVALVGAVALLRPPPDPAPDLTLPMAGAAPAAPATTTTTLPPDVAVHAAGAVAEPGVYHLAGTARVADLLDAAGGAAAGADLDRMNLAAVLVDGARVYVPRLGEAVPAVEGGDGGVGPAGGSGGGVSASGAPVDLNTADASVLETLPGVGPATATAILDERERRGRFATVDELLEVRGIGDAKLAALRDLVVAG